MNDQQAITEAFHEFQQANGTINFEQTIINMGQAMMDKDVIIAQLKSGQKGQLKAEIVKLKEQLAEMTQFHEWDKIANEKWADEKAKNEKLRAENEKLKAENEKLRSADISGACDSDSDSESDEDFEKDKCEAKELIEQMIKNGHIGVACENEDCDNYDGLVNHLCDKCEEVACDFCDKPRKHLVKRDAGYDEHTCEECYKEQYAEEVWDEERSGPQYTNFKKEVAVGEGDVGWEKY